MIHTALAFVRERLNQHFKIENPDLQEDKVVLSNIINSDGSQVEKLDNKIVFFLVQLDDEAALKNRLNRTLQQENGSFGHRNPGLHLNLHLLFTANFNGNTYIEGLAYLSSLIRYFRINSSIIPGAVPIPTKTSSDKANRISNIGKLSFELCKLDYNEMSHLWSAVGSKLLPSVLYKVRILTMEEAPITKTIPSIREPRNL